MLILEAVGLAAAIVIVVAAIIDWCDGLLAYARGEGPPP